MKSRTLYSILFLFQTLLLSAQITDWSQSYGAAAGAELSFLSPHPNGIIAAGNFLESFPLNANTVNSQGGSDIFILWIDSLGNTSNSLFLGNENNDYIRGMDSDANGNLYIAGEFKGNLQLGNYSLQSYTQSNFIAKIDANGQVIWAERIYGSGSNRILDLQLDVNQQNILVSGYFNDTLAIQGQLMHETVSTNLFVLKLNTTGSLQWMQKTPRSIEAKAWSIAALPDGKIWVAAEFRDSIYLPQDTFYIHPSYTDILVAQLDSNGQWLQSKRWGGVYNDRPKRLRLSPDQQNLWMAGEFVGVLHLDNNIELRTAFKYYDIFWVKMNLNGTSLAAGQSNTIANCYLNNIHIAADGLWLGGYFQDSLVGYNQTHLTNGGFDAYWFRVDSSNAALSASRAVGGTDNDLVNALLVKNNHLAVGGSFQESMNIGNNTLYAVGFSNAWLSWMTISSALLIESFRIPTLITIQIVPNPSSDTFRIVLEAPTELQWELYSLNGQRVARGTSDLINIAQLPAGTYSLTVYTEKGMGVAKVVKN